MNIQQLKDTTSTRCITCRKLYRVEEILYITIKDRPNIFICYDCLTEFNRQVKNLLVSRLLGVDDEVIPS